MFIKLLEIRLQAGKLKLRGLRPATALQQVLRTELETGKS